MIDNSSAIPTVVLGSGGFLLGKGTAVVNFCDVKAFVVINGSVTFWKCPFFSLVDMLLPLSVHARKRPRRGAVMIQRQDASFGRS